MFKSFLRERNRETSVLNTDRFDKRRFGQIYDMSKGLKELKAGEEEEIPLFKELLGDIWASLYKMNPELKNEDEIGEHLQPNKQLIERLMNEESYQEYRETTRLDDLISAVGTIKFGEKTSEWIQEQRLKNEELEKQLQKIQQLMKQMKKEDTKKDRNGAEQEGQKQGESQTEKDLNQAMSALAQQMNQALNNNGQSFSNAMQQAVNETKDAKKGLESLFGGLQAGSGKGELQKMPLRNKIALAEILTHDKKIKDIAKWAGRYTQIARTKQKMKHKESTEQSGVEAGNDLEKLLPSELVQYVNPKTKNEFLRRFSEKETLQYEQKGKETLGQGSIILCIDQSGSMDHLETQSKGFALALISIAKRQKRNFAYIPFSSHVGKVRQFPKGKIAPNEMIELAREFLNGGTNFHQPLKMSLEIINKDRFKDADIIFVTDGNAGIPSQFINVFNKKKEKEEFNVLSLLIGQNAKRKTVESFSDRIVGIRDFNDEGSFEAFEI